MTPDNSARALVDQLQAESDLLLTGDFSAVLEGQKSKRALIEKMQAGLGDPGARHAVRSAARRQQRLLRASLAGINAARSLLLGASKPAPVTSYTAKGAMRTLTPGLEMTLKKI